jgi:23S rRNA (uridine2552-2'-O)-methyltransferase
MKRAKTSKTWMKEHVNDFFVKKAKKEGYRSRAAYKLAEIAERDGLFRSGMTIVDLGAAPGGWSQVASLKLGEKARIIALDLDDMEPLPGVTFIRGDFTDAEVLARLKNSLGKSPVDLVISDMSPNISGVAISDQARSMYLAELALEFCRERLNSSGAFLVKVFQGAGFEEFLRSMRMDFNKVVTRKPEASRDRSSELYLLGIGKRY